MAGGLIEKKAVLLECARCGAHTHANAHIEYPAADDEDQRAVPAVGTLTGDWVVRWVRSHQEPRLWIVTPERVDAA